MLNCFSWTALVLANILGVFAAWDWNGTVPINNLLTLFVLSLVAWGAWAVTFYLANRKQGESLWL